MATPLKAMGLAAAIYSKKDTHAKKIVVDIDSQSLMATEGEKEIFSFRCVTGDADHPTPRKKYRVLEKDRIHFSHDYHAQMNFALRLTASGIFIHEGYNLVKNPADQHFAATLVSDSTAGMVSYARNLFPQISKLNISVGGINLTGSHGCIRLKHSDAVKLFEWADLKTDVEIK
jgi:lipoprotein-anchoring transpeptidase ErfK/SrfK